MPAQILMDGPFSSSLEWIYWKPGASTGQVIGMCGYLFGILPAP
jgi:hypothetical protein